MFVSTTASVHRWLLTYCKVERDEVVNCSCISLPSFCYRRLLKYSLATISQAATSSTIKHLTNNKQKKVKSNNKRKKFDQRINGDKDNRGGIIVRGVVEEGARQGNL